MSIWPMDSKITARRSSPGGSYTRAVPEAIALAVHRLVLRTQSGPLRALWRFLHALLTRAVVALIGRGRASAYLRASFGYDDVIYGLSDIDLPVVFPDPESAALARHRWARLARLVPGLGHLVQPTIYDRAELALVSSAPTLTVSEPVHLGPAPPHDEAYLRFRPGLFGQLCDWRPLTARTRRIPPASGQDADQRRLAAWLELQRWWREAFFACAHPGGPRLPYLCVKLVAEPARIWLWLVHGERVTGRREALERALVAMPDEEQALRAALSLHAALGRSPEAELADALTACVRLSDRLARRLEDEVGAAGSTAVRLTWGDQSELALPGHTNDALTPLAGDELRLLPLCDWRARAWPVFPDDAFAPVPLDATDPPQLGAAALAAGDHGPYAAVLRGRVLILPGPGLLRAVQCAPSDPVSFALLAGEDVAAFPDVPGWSAQDSARRALDEHRAWIGARREGRRSALAEWMESQARTTDAAGETIGKLLTAARAALFAHSVQAGEAELLLTLAAVARRLGDGDPDSRTLAEEAYGHYRRWRLDGGPVPSRVVDALRETVLGLPGYSFDDPWKERLPA
jgi:hypothetical protein